MSILKSEISDQISEIRLIIGCMTGTSLDGLDAALVEITGHGLEMKAKFVAMTSLPLGALRDELRHFASGGAAEPIRFMRAARRLGELHAEAVAALCLKSAISDPRSEIAFVVAHGQTIWHAPEDRGDLPPLPSGERAGVRGENSDTNNASAQSSAATRQDRSSDSRAHPSPGGDPRNSPPPSPQRGEGAQQPAGLSWQLFDPWPIVRRLGVPVCYDLRQADLIAGGQGAPITPISDWVMYADEKLSRLIVNLGGICNISDIGYRRWHGKIYGGDCGPCNIVIDGVVRELFPDREYDHDGLIAQSGRADSWVEELIRRSPYFTEHARRSTGREDFSPAFIADLVRQARTRLSPADVVASAVEAIARIIADSIYADEAHEVILAGGGAKNPALTGELRRLCEGTYRVWSSDELGIPVDAREAMGFAVLGALSQDGVPLTHEINTGAVNPGRAGAWVYP